MFAGSSAAVPAGASGRPISDAVSISDASWASALPSWEPKAIPPICPIICSSGPAASLASAGSASIQAPEICRATGSHSRCHVGSVFSTQVRGDQATADVAPAGNWVAASSHSSARWAASRTAAFESSPPEKPRRLSPVLPALPRVCRAICLARS